MKQVLNIVTGYRMIVSQAALRRIVTAGLVILALPITVAATPHREETALPELYVISPHYKFLHIVGYMRETSTMSSYSDTVLLFREKLVDFLLTNDGRAASKGWRVPRTLASRSYYRFMDSNGLDSVSDKCNHHFSWSDWLGLPPAIGVPQIFQQSLTATDTIKGKYSIAEVWNRKNDEVSIKVNPLAAGESRRWIPELKTFLDGPTDFNRMRLSMKYDNVLGDLVLPQDLSECSFEVESFGRGRNMFRFSKSEEPLFVTTVGELHILDREFITLREAKKWRADKAKEGDIEFCQPYWISEPGEEIKTLIARVEGVDRDQVRLSQPPDLKMLGPEKRKINFAQWILGGLKQMFGIDEINGRRKRNAAYRQFRREQVKKNMRRKQ